VIWFVIRSASPLKNVAVCSGPHSSAILMCSVHTRVTIWLISSLTILTFLTGSEEIELLGIVP